MAIIPGTRHELLRWGEEHLEPFNQVEKEFGVEPRIVGDYREALKTFKQRAETTAAARAALEVEMAALKLAERQFRDAASICVQSTKALAMAKNMEDEIYARARLPRNKVGRTPIGVEPAYELSAVPRADGTVHLKWKGNKPTGQFYVVLRNLDGKWVEVGVVGGRAFLDETLPGGCASVSYQVRAQKGAQVAAPCDPIVVWFGRSGSG